MPAKRTPLVDRVPKELKLTQARGRKPVGVPAHIRVDGVRITDDDREFIRRKLNDRFGRYGKSIERVSVRLRDVNGPKGGVDVSCTVKVVLGGQPSIVVENQAATFEPALLASLAGAVRTLRKALQRKRTRTRGSA